MKEPLNGARCRLSHVVRQLPYTDKTYATLLAVQSCRVKLTVGRTIGVKSSDKLLMEYPSQNYGVSLANITRHKRTYLSCCTAGPTVRYRGQWI